jgi:glycosyltransferase involved in cell wall biosynthesis
MKISIIIPNRGRDASYALCFDSLLVAWEEAGVLTGKSLEIVNADQLLVKNAPAGPFCKSLYLNRGIEAATGDVLVFLDADAIVPPAFFDTIHRLDDPTLTKLCYRVRRLPQTKVDGLLSAPDKHQFLADLFAQYDSYDHAFEGYGRPSWDRPKPCQPVFGNSQFAIRRDTLGDLRFDEEYVGRGYEDMDMNLRIWERYGDAYRAEIVTDAKHAILHVTDPSHDAHWNDSSGNLNYFNSLRYRRKEAKWLDKFTTR